MLFNSFEFIFLFVPVTVCIYFTLSARQYFREAKAWLMVASLFFYGWWNPSYLLLIGTSLILNFLLARLIDRRKTQALRKFFLVTGLVFNVGLLIYYKYADFFIGNFNHVFQSDFNLLNI